MTFRVAPPHTDDCAICDRPLGSVPLLKRRSAWVHKACWMEAHE